MGDLNDIKKHIHNLANNVTRNVSWDAEKDTIKVFERDWSLFSYIKITEHQ